MTTAVLKYDAACQAIAEAKTVDEVTDWIDKAAAVREYGRRIKDRRMELDAIEIRVIAKRRRGELLAAMKAAGRLVVGKTKLMSSDPDMVTLDDLGIERNESSEDQKLAALPLDSFERLKARCRAYAEEHPEKHSFEVLQEDRTANHAASRRDIAQALADTSDQLLTGRKVPAIYIDPAFARKAGIGDRAYENHYPTEKWDSILAIMQKAANRLQPNAWAFIWIPRAHMLALHPVPYTIQTDDGATHVISIKTPLIWAIARALGCTGYSTCFVWTKTDEDHPDEHGTFLVCKDQDEILCLYKKGDGRPKPKPQHIYGSNHRERSRPLGHSTKPPFYRKMIADMVGCSSDGRPLPVLEMFCRHDEANPLPENWEAWGNESLPENRNDATKPATNITENIPADAESLAETSSDASESGVEDNPPPHGASLQQGLDTSSTPGTAVFATGPQGEGAGAASVANPEAASDWPSHAAPGASETFDEESRWHDDGGSAFRSDDLIMKPLRSTRRTGRV